MSGSINFKYLQTFSNLFICYFYRNRPQYLRKSVFSLTLRDMIINVNKYQFFRLKHQFKSRWPYLLVWTLPFLNSSTEDDTSKGHESKIGSEKKDVKSLIKEADELFESKKYEEASTVLRIYRESREVEILWRLSRALYNQAQCSVTSKADKQQLINDAFIVISEALNLDNSHWAVHKWMSVLLDAHSAYDGIKARVMQLEKVKSHMLRAVELNPNDATTFYMLGSWCYQIADMPWFQRKIAATIFAAPPTSSFEEALTFFSKAEEIDPRFYSQNLLMLGKTLLKLERPDEAAHYLSLAREYPSSAEEDNLVRKEATEILKNIKAKEN